jgi:hypothetical protein
MAFHKTDSLVRLSGQGQAGWVEPPNFGFQEALLIHVDPSLAAEQA